MEKTFILVKKELKEFFNSPTPYILFVVFLLITGWFFAAPLFIMNQAVLDEFLGILPLLFVFFLPAVTMRLFAEEIKIGTVEILTTLPLKDTEILLGKYITAVIILCANLILTLIYPIILGISGNPDWGQIVSSYIGIFLLGSAFTAVGIFASALTKNQIISFIVGFFICFIFFLIGKFTQLVPSPLGNILDSLGIDSHFNPFIKGVVYLRDIVYFLGFIVIFLTAAYSILNSRRWR